MLDTLTVYSIVLPSLGTGLSTLIVVTKSTLVTFITALNTLEDKVLLVWSPSAAVVLTVIEVPPVLLLTCDVTTKVAWAPFAKFPIDQTPVPGIKLPWEAELLL